MRPGTQPRKCWGCGEEGHFVSNCPNQAKAETFHAALAHVEENPSQAPDVFYELAERVDALEAENAELSKSYHAEVPAENGDEMSSEDRASAIHAFDTFFGKDPNSAVPEMRPANF